jgi:DUF1680 family protein
MPTCDLVKKFHSCLSTQGLATRIFTKPSAKTPSGRKKIDGGEWKDKLYKKVSKKPAQKINVRLVPYYAWGNRGHTEMSVWLTVIK